MLSSVLPLWILIDPNHYTTTSFVPFWTWDLLWKEVKAEIVNSALICVHTFYVLGGIVHNVGQKQFLCYVRNRNYVQCRFLGPSIEAIMKAHYISLFHCCFASLLHRHYNKKLLVWFTRGRKFFVNQSLIYAKYRNKCYTGLRILVLYPFVVWEACWHGKNDGCCVYKRGQKE